MITNYEKQYVNIIKNVMENGYYDQNRTGVATKKLPHQIIQVDLEKEFPILKTKQVYWKTATKEIMWIMQKQSNNIKDLDGHIWDEWADEDGSIGKAYGYQVREYKQIDNLIKALKENPQDRRMMVNLWNWHDLPEMNLAPCCFLSMWDVTDGKLNCMLVQRSGDLPLGVPFNTTQYSILTHLIAQSCGLKVGLLTHVINNAHIYENQFDGINEQLKRYEDLQDPYMSDNDILAIYKSQPILELNKSIDDFYKFTIEDIKVIDYKHMGRIDMPVSV